MANYCFTKYAVEGSMETLRRICDAVNTAGGWASAAVAALGLSPEDFEQEYEQWHRAEWEEGARIEEADGRAVLFFTEAYPWMKADIIDRVLEELGEEDASVYFLSECFEEGVHFTNDSEGRYFPERFRVYTENDEDNEYFRTKEEALEHIRTSYGLSAEHDTYEKVKDWCDGQGLCCAMDPIEVREQDMSTSGREKLLKDIFSNSVIVDRVSLERLKPFNRRK